LIASGGQKVLLSDPSSLTHLIQPDWNFELTGVAQSVELA